MSDFCTCDVEDPDPKKHDQDCAYRNRIDEFTPGQMAWRPPEESIVGLIDVDSVANYISGVNICASTNVNEMPEGFYLTVDLTIKDKSFHDYFRPGDRVEVTMKILNRKPLEKISKKSSGKTEADG